MTPIIRNPNLKKKKKKEKEMRKEKLFFDWIGSFDLVSVSIKVEKNCLCKFTGSSVWC